MVADYVIFDGMDGSGKGTQIELLKKKFGDSVVFTREPGGTPFAEDIRKVILDNPLAGESTALNNLLLFFAAREELQKNLVVPSRKAGKTVFSDRGDSSTFAFQLYGEMHTEFLSTFRFLRNVVFGNYFPNLYIIFDLPAETARKRVMNDANRAPNHFDVRGLDYYTRVREGFRAFERFAPVEFVSATQTAEEVHESVLAILARRQIFPIGAP